jgi:hypothetical protein
MTALLVFLPHCDAASLLPVPGDDSAPGVPSSCGAASLLPVPGDGSAPGVPSSGCPQSESSFHEGWPAAAPCHTAQVKLV